MKGLAEDARRRLAAGEGVEQVARDISARRNTLKLEFRRGDPPAVVAMMERRNEAAYGNPVGPSPEWSFAKYGRWDRVIDAACRPADLSRTESLLR